MYIKDPFFTTPPDETPLWRYMNLSRFLHLVRSRGLYFARKHELEDDWEGALPQADYVVLRLFMPVDEPFGNRKRGLEESMRTVALNCWHQNECESVAMWNLYTTGTDGVAIKSSVGGLKEALKNDVHATYIGRVEYLDYSSPLPDDFSRYCNIQALFRKRRSYQHESEVRACIWEQLQPDGVPEHSPDVGFQVPVSLDALIERIVVSPKYPAWAIPTLQEQVGKAGLAIQVETSDLLKEPKKHLRINTHPAKCGTKSQKSKKRKPIT